MAINCNSTIDSFSSSLHPWSIGVYMQLHCGCKSCAAKQLPGEATSQWQMRAVCIWWVLKMIQNINFAAELWFGFYAVVQFPSFIRGEWSPWVGLQSCSGSVFRPIMCLTQLWAGKQLESCSVPQATSCLPNRPGSTAEEGWDTKSAGFGVVPGWKKPACCFNVASCSAGREQQLAQGRCCQD